MSDRSVFVCPKSGLNIAAGTTPARSTPHRPRRRTSLLLAGLMALDSTPQTMAAVVACKPLITIQHARLSDLQMLRRDWSNAPLPLRVWNATLSVDASRCATSSGWFEMDFLRLNEVGPEQQFTEKFEWKPGTIEISMDLQLDEFIQDYRIGFIAPCVCRDLPY